MRGATAKKLRRENKRAVKAMTFNCLSNRPKLCPMWLWKKLFKRMFKTKK